MSHTFEEGGKDKFARRALFTTFCNLVAPEKKWSGCKIDMNIHDEEFAGFRKSAGIWYHGEKKDVCWDRRLVLWIKARAGSYLPFFDCSGNLVTNQGMPLVEAGLCTLEVVLRNSATYTIGFLLTPKYKPHQDERIEKASSWIVIGYFPFPDSSDGPIRSVEGCVTDQRKIVDLLLANKLRHSNTACKTFEAPESQQTSTTNDDDDAVVVASKSAFETPMKNQNKGRNIEACEDDMLVKNMEVYPSATSSPVSSRNETMMMDDDDDDDADVAYDPIERKSFCDGQTDETMMCDDVKKEDGYYNPFCEYDCFDDQDLLGLVGDRDINMNLFPASTDFNTASPVQSSSPKLLYSDIPSFPFCGAQDPLFVQPFFFNSSATAESCDSCSLFRTDSSTQNTSFPWLS